MDIISKAELTSGIDLASTALSLAFKLGLTVGGACLLFYCYRISYFPVGLSLGDALLLILLAVSFGMLYSMFVAGLACFGLWLTLILIPVLRFRLFLLNSFSKKKAKPYLDPIRPGMGVFLFGIIGVVFIYFLSIENTLSILTLVITAFVLGMLVTIYHDINLQIIASSESRDSIIQVQARKPNYRLNMTNPRSARYAVMVLIMFLPILFAGVAGSLLDGSMRLAGIRKAPAFVMLSPPYSELMPRNLEVTGVPALSNYTAFERTKVLFSGIGTMTVLQYPTEDGSRTITVPNDKIIAVSR